MKRNRIVDIARKAEVSPTTVSFVLSGKARQYRISRDLEDRILSIADEVGYIPNLLARGLRSRTSNIIGIISLGEDDPYGYMFVEAIEKVASRDGFNTFIGYSRRDPLLLEKRIEQFLNWNVAGIILEWVPGFEKTKMFKTVQKGLPCPVVTIRTHVHLDGIINIAFAIEDILSNALDKAFALGHSRIMVLDSIYQTYDQEIRHRILLKTLKERGVPIENTHVLTENDQNMVAERVSALFAQHREHRPTLVIGYAYPRAAGAYLAAQRCRLRVPEDISILAITGYSQTPFQKAKLDQYRYDHRGLGITAFRTLAQVLQNTFNGPAKIYTPLGQWITGETLGPAPRHAAP